MSRIAHALSLAAIAFFAIEARAQQTTIATPLSRPSSSFSEQSHTSWGLSGRNWTLGFNAPVSAPFGGGGAASAGATGGIGLAGNGVNGYFQFGMGQSSQRSNVSQTPMLTTMPGQWGYVADTSISPFVIGYIPVTSGLPATFGPFATTYSPGAGGLPAFGAVAPVANLNGTTVQLPTFSQFSTGTTVNVPDGGGVNMGGINRGAMGQDRAGMPLGPKNQAIGANRGAAGMQVRAQIHDMKELEEAVLAAGEAAGAGRGGVEADAERQALAAAARSSAGQAAPSVAALRQQAELERAGQGNEFEALWAKAQDAEAQGKLAVARVHYQVIARRGPSELKEKATARLAALAGSTTSAR